MLNKAFGDSCMSKTQAYEWYKEFNAGREIVEYLSRSNRPSSSTIADNIDKNKILLLEIRHMSVRDLAQERDISTMSSYRILSDILGMKRVAERLLPKELNVLQKEHRKQVALDMVSRADSEPNFMNRIITGGETWVYEYDMQTSRQSSEWRYDDEPKPKKPRQSRSKVKVM
ncbi:hypothetical protein NQ318_020630 [Aromia moschata]|uniref:Mos1 transposase HTH domain-containing protein n=1 Tax=Aromia moschata TaxID=1265417 RepID=A0AAV8Z183_9CUCU|nr:hypothetical protein NQ318_020630 [Aromia moschata]